MFRFQSVAFKSQLCKSTRVLPLLFLAACSTLRVDVDVYKGPLINEKKVQKSQLAGMVLGAKPMLRQVDMALRHDGSQSGGMLELDLIATFVEEILSSYENNQAVGRGRNRWHRAAGSHHFQPDWVLQFSGSRTAVRRGEFKFEVQQQYPAWLLSLFYSTMRRAVKYYKHAA